MFEVFKKYQKPLIILLIAFMVIVGLLLLNRVTDDSYALGALIHPGLMDEDNTIQAVASTDEALELSERFQRPSRQPALDTKYHFRDFANSDVIPVFKNPEDLIKAYYAILKEASNMENHHGGCGTIGLAKEPYPFAYKLLTQEEQKKISLKKFTDSFQGTGHITLLKLLPAYIPDKTPDNLRYYFAEIEAITGPQVSEATIKKPQPSFFAYYYGLITVENSPQQGWKIKSIDYIPEDFLCAPYHSWFWEAKAVVEIIYQNWYKLIDQIEKVEVKDSEIRVYAKGKDKEYRFDFIQLTNGEHVLLHEYVHFSGKWQEVNLLRDKDQVFKLSILNPRLKR